MALQLEHSREGHRVDKLKVKDQHIGGQINLRERSAWLLLLLLISKLLFLLVILLCTHHIRCPRSLDLHLRETFAMDEHGLGVFAWLELSDFFLGTNDKVAKTANPAAAV